MSSQGTDSSRRTTVVIGAAVLVLVAAAVLVTVLFTRGSDDADADAGASPPASATTDGGFRVGGDAAQGVEQVQVIVYDDFLCAQCAEDEEQIGGYLGGQAETGVVNVEYRLVAMPGDSEAEQSYAVRSAAAAVCVAEKLGSEEFLVYRRALYLNRQALIDNGYEDADLSELASNEDLGDAVECIESDAYEEWVTQNTETATAAGVDTVPTVLVAGEPVDAGDDDTLQLQEILDAVSTARVGAE